MANTATTDTPSRDELDSADLKGSQHDLLELKIEDVPSVTLARLIEEVRNETTVGRSYNRTYNRHNR